MSIILALVLLLNSATAMGQLRYADVLPFDHPTVASVKIMDRTLR